MHRIILRVACKCISDYSRNLPKDRSRVQRVATRNIQWHQTFSTSQAYQYTQSQLGTGSAQLQIVNALHLGERGRASDMLLELGSSNCSLSSDDFAYILDYCAHTPDPDFGMKTWRLMEEKSVPIDERCYRAIIKALCKQDNLKKALDWLVSATERDFDNASLPLYNIFLSECESRSKFAAIEECIEVMERQHVGKSEITYCKLLKSAVLQKDLSAVKKIWKDCTMYYSPCLVTLKKFVWSFSTLNDVEAANSILQHMRILAFQESVSVKKASAGSYQSLRLDIPIPLRSELTHSIFGSTGINSNGGFTKMKPEMEKRHDEEFEEVKGNVTLPVKELLTGAYNNVIQACARASNCDLAEYLFRQMHDIGLEPTGVTYNALVKAAMHGEGLAYAMKVIKSMEEKNIEAYMDTLAALSTGHSKILELDAAENLLEKIIPSSPPEYIYPVNTFLGACYNMNQPERAIRILAKLKRANMKLNIRTYEHIFSLFGVVNYPYMPGNWLSHQDVAKRINAIEEDMLRNGVRHSYTSIKNLIRSLGAEGMLHDMIQFLSRVESMFLSINPREMVAIYNVALNALVDGNESTLAFELFEYMRQGGFPLTEATYVTMIRCCRKSSCFKSASALLCMMLCAGLVPHAPEYASLIKVLIASKDFKKALALLDQALSQSIEFDIKLFNAFLKPTWKGQLGITEKIVELIHIKNIQPDPSTCWYTVKTYAEAGLHSTALEALQVLSLRMISEDQEMLEEHKTKYEELIYSEEPDAESKILDIFNSNEFIATALLGLRWYAMVSGSDVCWCPNESPWAKRLSSLYDLSGKGGVHGLSFRTAPERHVQVTRGIIL